MLILCQNNLKLIWSAGALMNIYDAMFHSLGIVKMISAQQPCCKNDLWLTVWSFTCPPQPFHAWKSGNKYVIFCDNILVKCQDSFVSQYFRKIYCKYDAYSQQLPRWCGQFVHPLQIENDSFSIFSYIANSDPDAHVIMFFHRLKVPHSLTPLWDEATPRRERAQMKSRQIHQARKLSPK